MFQSILSPGQNATRSSPTSTLQGNTFTISGAVQAAFWGSNGIATSVASTTYTDISSAASSTLTFNAVNAFGTPTLAALRTGITYTTAATLYIGGAPTASNATITNAYALYVSSGTSFFGGNTLKSLNSNAALTYTISNNVAGSVAQSYYQATDGTYVTNFGQTNTSFTTAGGVAANQGFITTSAISGLTFVSSANSITFAANGTTSILEIDNGGINLVLAGSAASPVIGLGGLVTTTTGFYGSGSNVGVTVNGTGVANFTSTGLNSTAIGATTPSTGAFTNLSVNSANIIGIGGIIGDFIGIEPTAYNWIRGSTDFTSSQWSVSNASVTSSTVVAPDGGLYPPQTITDTSTTAFGSIRNGTLTITADTTPYTFSCYVHSSSTSTAIEILITFTGGTTLNSGMTFNPSTQTVSTNSTTPTAYGFITIPDGLGGYWYRIYATMSNNGTNNQFHVTIFPGADNVADTNYAICWGPQFEIAYNSTALPTSYIPNTSTSAVSSTRTFGSSFVENINTSSLAFLSTTISAPANGFNLSASNTISGYISSTQVSVLTSTGLSLVPAGSATAPVLGLGSATSTTGLYGTAGTNVGITISGTSVANFTSTGLSLVPAGSATAPVLGLGSATSTTGLYGTAGTNVGITIGGTSVANFTSTGLNSAAIGATTPSTGNFTTITVANNANSATTATITNTTSGTAAQEYFSTSDGTHLTNFGQTNASFTTTGGVAASQGFITSSATSGLAIVSSVGNATIAAGGTSAIATFTSTGINNTAIGTTTASTGSFTSGGYSGVATFTGLDVHTVGVTLSSHAATATNGTIWNDSTQNSMGYYQNGLTTYTSSLIWAAKTSFTTASGTTAQSIFATSAVGTLTLPANFLVVGKTIRIALYGVFTSTSSPGTVTFTLTLGGTTLVTNSGTPGVSQTNQGVVIEILITCVTTGTSGTVNVGGNLLTGSSTGVVFPLTATSTVTINTTTSLAINLTQTNATSNGIIYNIRSAVIEALC